MNKILSIFMVLMLVAVPLMAADWTYTIKTVEQKAENPDTLTTTVEYSDGVKTFTETIPLFQPKTKEEVLTGIKNRAATIKQRLAAEALITATVKPDVDKEINKPTPTLTAVEG